MNNDVQQDATCRLFQFEGELRKDHIEALYDLAQASSGSHPPHILIDLRRVNRFDDEALEALETFQQSIAEQHGKVILVGVTHPKLTNVIFLEVPATDPAISQDIA